jgi:hypothetical protein
MRKRVSVFVCMHLERHEVEKLSRLLQCRDAAVWVHIRVCNWQAVDVLSGGCSAFTPIAGAGLH